ncbi:MAG: hypothetical protein QXG05_03280 [Nitrososphaerota archaeon]
MSSFTTVANNPTTITAIEDFYVSVSANPSAGGSVSPNSGWYPAGSVATASETPATGYHFVDWTNGNTGSTYSFTMNGPNSIGANFGINTYTVTFQSSPAEGAPVTMNGNSETTPYSVVVDYGATVSYSYGSSFSGGSGVRYVDPSTSSGSFTVIQHCFEPPYCGFYILAFDLIVRFHIHIGVQPNAIMIPLAIAWELIIYQDFEDPVVFAIHAIEFLHFQNLALRIQVKDFWVCVKIARYYPANFFCAELCGCEFLSSVGYFSN